MAETSVYEVLAIRYAFNPGQRASQNFIGGVGDDHAMPLDYFVWLIRGPERTILVDTGFNAAMAQKRNRVFIECPAKTLARLGVDPSISEIVITHLHYDHAGNSELFPAACFYIQRTEMAYATGHYMAHPELSRTFEVEDVVAMLRNTYLGRVVFVDGTHELAPGVILHRIGGHTDGTQVVRVWTRRGWVVLASDASHFYANLHEGRSFPIVYNVGDTLEGYRVLRSLADGLDHIIPGHDPLVMRQYPAVEGFEGLVVRLHEDPRPGGLESAVS